MTLGRRQLLGGLALLAAAPASLCAGCADAANAPADPVWGKQACAHCAMHVGDRRTAAQLTTGDGARLHFDDVGCLVAYVDERHVRVRRAWVRDETGTGWADASAARFRGGAATPMDFGFVAVAGGGISYDQMAEQVRARVAGGASRGADR